MLDLLDAVLDESAWSETTTFDVGVMWDFMSLPQEPRSEEEKTHFKKGLSVINKVYGSAKNTYTVQITETPPHITPYSGSGWCRFEESVSGIGKQPSYICDLDAFFFPRRTVHPNEEESRSQMLAEFARKMGVQYHGGLFVDFLDFTSGKCAIANLQSTPVTWPLS